MAIDTAAKRRSAGGIAYFIFGPGVTPDATPGGEWRQQAGWGYSGIAAGAAAVTSQVCTHMLLTGVGSVGTG